MSYKEPALCLICGRPATQYFENTMSLPLCSNRACEEELLDEINEEAAVAAIKENE